MKAQAIQNAVTVNSFETLPDGVKVVMVPCEDFSDFQTLPKAIHFDGQDYGLTGWNSDHHLAYYRDDKRFATVAK